MLDAQVDLILESLQLYAFNFHRVWAIDKDSNLEDLRNALLFHTYEQIASKYHVSRLNYNVLDNCRLQKQRKNKMIYMSKKKFA